MEVNTKIDLIKNCDDSVRDPLLTKEPSSDRSPSYDGPSQSTQKFIFSQAGPFGLPHVPSNKVIGVVYLEKKLNFLVVLFAKYGLFN